MIMHGRDSFHLQKITDEVITSMVLMKEGINENYTFKVYIIVCPKEMKNGAKAFGGKRMNDWSASSNCKQGPYVRHHDEDN